MDNVRNNIGHSFLWMTWSGVVSIANSLLLWIFFARLRDVDELGRFTIVMGLYALFFNICSLGLFPYLVNEISRRMDGEKRTTAIVFICSASVFLFGVGTLCCLVMTGSGFFLTNAASARLSIAVLSLSMVPTALMYVAEASALSFGRTRLIAFVTTLENILRTVIPLYLLWAGYSIPVICLSFTCIRFAMLAVYLAAGSRVVSSFLVSTADIVRIAKASPIFAATTAFSAINWQTSILLLGYISSESESARFGVASRFLIPVSILLASYASVIQPLIARHTDQGSGTPGRYLTRMSNYPLIIATIAAILSPFLSRHVLTAFFGNSYADAAPTLDVLALCVIPFSLVMVVSRGLVAANMQHIDLLANMMGAVACFAAGVFLIPTYGATGAAVAQLLSFALMALIEIIYLSRKIGGVTVWRTASVSSACLLLVYTLFFR